MFNYWHENDTNEYHNTAYSDMYNIGIEPAIPGCVSIIEDSRELANRVAKTFKDFDKHSVKFVQTWYNGRLVAVRESELKQEELLDKTYREIVHLFDGVYYIWFVITFDDKLKGK